MRRALLLTALLLALPARAQTPAANPSFNLVNRGSQAILEVYATPAGIDRWGRDRLTTYSIPPGQTFPVRLPPGDCAYDIRIVWADRRNEERRRIDTCRVESIVFPNGRTTTNATRQQTDDPSFRLVNRGRNEITELYATPVGEDGWGPDRLGDDTVSAGATRVVRLPSGQCTWDVRIVFTNGEATEKRRIDLCALTDLRVP